MTNIQIQQPQGGDFQTTDGGTTARPEEKAATPEVQNLINTQRKEVMKKLAESDAADDGKTRLMQRFYRQNDSTGSEDGDELHGKMAKAAKGMGLPGVGKANMQNIAVRVSEHPATKEMASQIKDVMQGKGEMPGAQQLASAAGRALGETNSFGASIGQPVATRGLSVKLAGAGAASADAAADSADNANQADASTAPDNTSAPQAAGGPTSTDGATDPSDPTNFKSVVAGVENGSLPVSAVAGDVIGFVYAVMMAAQIDGNKDKREELNHIKMLNGMSDGLSDYMAKLVSAQETLSAKTAKASDKDRKNPSNITVTVDDVPSGMDTDYAPTNMATGKVQPAFSYDKDGGRKQLDQQSLSALNSQIQQWQQSIQNNQTKQTNRFQATDSAQTSNMNIINSLLKSVHDATNAIVHNLMT